MITSPVRHKFTVQDVNLMDEVGVFSVDQRIELLDGELTDMSPIHPPHAFCVNLLNRFFSKNLPAEFLLSVQNPVLLSENSLLQPDLVISNFQETNREQHIKPSAILLVIEVADSSYKHDRTSKWEQYALAGIPEYWIVNLQKRQFELFAQPDGNEYTASNTHKESFTSSLGFEVPVEEFLPSKA